MRNTVSQKHYNLRSCKKSLRKKPATAKKAKAPSKAKPVRKPSRKLKMSRLKLQKELHHEETNDEVLKRSA